MLRFHPLRVVDVRPEAEDAVELSLDVPEALRSTFQALPGQHIVLRAQVAGAEERRTYSLVNAPGEWPLRIAVRVHEGGRMSGYLSRELRPGDTIDVLPPNGSFTPRVPPSSGGLYVGIAAGCGITPISGIARAVLAASPSSRFELFYGNRNTARTMLLEDLFALKDRYLGRLALHFFMSREPQEAEIYNGRLDGEKVRTLAQSLLDVPSVTEWFVCGPGTMCVDVPEALRALGVAPERIHVERFTVESGDEASRQAGEPARAAASAGDDSEATAEVTIVMDGRRRTFTMRMDGQTVLDAAAQAGIELPFSCKAGVCSTCRTKVVRGEVEMLQNYALEDWEVEQGYVLACQSKVKSRELELDYDER